MTTGQPVVIRVLVADDHAVIRKGIQAMLELVPDMQVVGEASNGRQAVALAEQLKPDVILMDLVMPQLSGVEAIRKIKEENPEVRILVLTSFAEDDKVFPADLRVIISQASPCPIKMMAQSRNASI